MTEPSMNFWGRVRLAWQLAWRTLTRPAFTPAAQQTLQSDLPAADDQPSISPAVQLLSLLQQEGRLLDFLEEDIASHNDAQIGSAVRVVHEGCRRALREHFTIETICPEPEGSAIRLEPGFDAQEISISGQVTGQPPFTGTLLHPGWRVTDGRLPALAPGHDPNIIAPAEVEL